MASENHSYLLLYIRWLWNDNHFYVRGESSITVLKVLEATVKNTVALEIRCPGLVYPCFKQLCGD
jgi:hypothetical protein